MSPLKVSLNEIIFMALLLIQGTNTLTLREEMYLTDDQQVAFDKFKNIGLQIITTPYMKSDLVLIKYFKFSEMNENKTLALLKDNLKWRMEQGFEALTEDEIADYMRLYPFSTFKDKLGRGVFFIAGKYWDLFAATKSSDLSAKFTKFGFHMMEEAYIQGVSNFTGKTGSGIIIVVDGKDTDLVKAWCGLCLHLLKQVVSQAEIRWPGGLQAVYILNAAPFLGQALILLKNALSKKLQESLFVRDENDAVWMPEMLTFIDKEKIPGDLYVRSQQNQAGFSPALSFLAPPPMPGSVPGPPQVEQGGKVIKKRK